MRTLLVDDEPPARDRLRRMLGEHPDVEVVAEAGDVAGAMRALVRRPVELIFLDIHLPGPDGFELLELLGRADRPALICVTANAEHAVRAFDEAATDYLLKPFSRERLAGALARVREHRRATQHGHPPPRRSRIPVPGPTGTRFVDQRHVVLVRGQRNYVRLDLGGRTVLLRGTLQDMAQRLSPADFVQVNRSVIVRIAAVAELRTLPHGEVELQLTTGEQVVSGRAYAAQVKAALGL